MKYSWLALVAMLTTTIAPAIDGNAFPPKSSLELEHERLTSVGQRALGLTEVPEFKVALTHASAGKSGNPEAFYFPTVQLLVARDYIHPRGLLKRDRATGVAVAANGTDTTIGYDWIGWENAGGPHEMIVHRYGFVASAGKVFEAAGSPVAKKYYHYELLVCLRHGKLPFTALTHVVRCHQMPLDQVLASMKAGESIHFEITNPNVEGESGSFTIEPIH